MRQESWIQKVRNEHWIFWETWIEDMRNLRIYESIILIWILKTCNVTIWTRFNCLKLIFTVGILWTRQGLRIFLFTTASRPALASTQPPIQWVSGDLSLGIKRPRREAEHSPPSSAEIKNKWSYNSTPQYAFTVWCSVIAQGHIYLYIVNK
jgi:hypothetical protein